MNMEQRKTNPALDENTIDLLRLAKAVWKRLWLVILVAVLFGAGAYIGTKVLITPTYRSSFTAYVNNKTVQEDDSVSSGDISASRSLTSTYSAVLVSQPLLEEAASIAGLDLTYGELAEAVSTDTVDDTEIIQVRVTMTDPQQALSFAEALAEAAPAYISKIVEGSSMQVIATPNLPTSIYAPNYLRNTEMGVLLGAVLVIAIIVLLELVDDRVKSESELEERCGIAVMGTIPDLVAAKKQGSGDGYYGYGYGKGK